MRDKCDPDTYFARPAGLREHWKAGAIVSFLIGFAVSYWGTTIFPAGFYDNVPLALVGSLVAAILYAAWVLVREQAGAPVPSPRGVSRPSDQARP